MQIVIDAAVEALSKKDDVSDQFAVAKQTIWEIRHHEKEYRCSAGIAGPLTEILRKALSN